MKIELATLIGYAGLIAQTVETGKQALAQIRTIVKRDHPEDLAAFDRAIAAARAPWEAAAQAAEAEGASKKRYSAEEEGGGQ